MFRDRRDAGRRLAGHVEHLAVHRPVVLGLPRGGVPVAFEVASALGAPLDVLVVRKLGCPWQPELGLGAISEGGIRLLNTRLIAQAQVSSEELEEVAARETAELERRVDRYRGGRAPVDVAGRVVILVDDGLATGFTARAAIAASRARAAQRVVLAVPVASPHTIDEMAEVADEVVCVEAPESFYAIGQFYNDFTQTSDEEVARLLTGTRRDADRADERTLDVVAADPEVVVDVDGVRLAGSLTVPPTAEGLVVFAHGSGSSRHSPRNRAVARFLSEAGLATLLFDLLTTAEEQDRGNVFDVGLLGRRLAGVTRWVAGRSETAGLPVGYFGSSTGAAAALIAAAELGDEVAAVVSRGGRPDLAGPSLGRVTAPTLLIVGGHDEAVLQLNEDAQRQLQSCRNQLAVVPGATHLFEEPGALEEVSRLARDWFLEHFRAHPEVPADPGGNSRRVVNVRWNRQAR